MVTAYIFNFLNQKKVHTFILPIVYEHYQKW